MDIRLRKLQRIYKEMARWAKDLEAVPRNMKAIHLPARIVIVGEAVGPSTLRFSGVNYFDQYGRLGPTGIRLDRMLVPFGYTIYPPCDIKVPKGMIDCIRGGG